VGKLKTLGKGFPWRLLTQLSQKITFSFKPQEKGEYYKNVSLEREWGAEKGDLKLTNFRGRKPFKRAPQLFWEKRFYPPQTYCGGKPPALWPF